MSDMQSWDEPPMLASPSALWRLHLVKCPHVDQDASLTPDTYRPSVCACVCMCMCVCACVCVCVCVCVYSLHLPTTLTSNSQYGSPFPYIHKNRVSQVNQHHTKNKQSISYKAANLGQAPFPPPHTLALRLL